MAEDIYLEPYVFEDEYVPRIIVILEEQEGGKLTASINVYLLRIAGREESTLATASAVVPLDKISNLEEQVSEINKIIELMKSEIKRYYYMAVNGYASVIEALKNIKADFVIKSDVVLKLAAGILNEKENGFTVESEKVGSETVSYIKLTKHYHNPRDITVTFKLIDINPPQDKRE